MHARRAYTVAIALLAASNAMAEDHPIAEILAKPSLNVVITVEDMDKATQFYGEVLGLERMPPIVFGDNTDPVFFPKPVIMQRFKVGSHEIKLIPGIESTEDLPRGVQEAIGFRLVNYPIADIEAFKKRLARHGYDEPTIGELPNSPYRFGLINDPDGNPVEFYYYDGAGPPGWEQSLQIGLTVSDIEASREFYGKTLGMNELPAIPSPMGNGKVYLFQNGPTLIKFWTFDKDIPNHAGRHLDAYGYRYIQYPAKEIDTAHAFMNGRGVPIDLPPTTVFRGLNIKIMFVTDPDGIIQEIFGPAR